MSLNILNILETKSRGDSLTTEQIEYIVNCVYDKNIDDAQIGAFLMAVKINGMSGRETADLSSAMAKFSIKFDWLSYTWGGLVVDKHSTGGIGDKISHILAPILAACGLKVPMISGRGLGITGGTIDKLEAIEGFSAEISPQRVGKVLEEVGFFVVGQTDSMVPVDKCFYAIRDVTGTVNSIPLITSSILSKKKIEGIQALVMDIKFGRGAFMETQGDAEELGRSMIETSKSIGMSIVCLIDDMNSPLGSCIGNALEIAETLRALNGEFYDDVKEIVYTSAKHLLMSVRTDLTETEVENLIELSVTNKIALEKFKNMLVSQGVSNNLAEKLCISQLLSVEEYLKIMDRVSPLVSVISIDEDGFVASIDAKALGELVRNLGGGRFRKEDVLDYSVGVEILLKEGDVVNVGDNWIKIFHNSPLTERVISDVKASITITKTSVSVTKRIKKVMS